MKKVVYCALVLGCYVVGSVQAATTVFSQGFESDASGWLDDDDFAGFGQVNRVASGTGGIASADGGFHAVMTQTGAGPFTRFDGYRSVWPDGFVASADIYLDTNWNLGEGFDYSVAANGSDGNHQRDFIFHITKDSSTGSLLVGGSNNTNFDPREDLETINHAVIGATGWYTFEHSFYDNLGQLAVDLILRDSGGSVLFTETRTDANDLIPAEVGGNRYGWFTNIDIADGIAVDNVLLAIDTQPAAEPVPEPSTVFLLGSGLVGLVLYRRRIA